jgi:hypothetical protein
MIYVCFAYTEREAWQQQWEYLLSHFKPDAVYVYGAAGRPAMIGTVLGSAIPITSTSELPGDASLVLLSSTNALNVPGDRSLVTFAHPLNAIYYLGSDSQHLEAEAFDGRQPDHKVYVPTDSADQMYSFVALAVALYDRRIG